MTRLLTNTMSEDALLTLLLGKPRRWLTNSSNSSTRNNSNRIIPHQPILPMTLLSCHRLLECPLSSNLPTISRRSRNPKLPTQTHQAFSNKRRPTNRPQCRAPGLPHPNTPLSTRPLQPLAAASTRHTSPHRVGRLRRTQHPSIDKEGACLWLIA